MQFLPLLSDSLMAVVIQVLLNKRRQYGAGRCKFSGLAHGISGKKVSKCGFVKLNFRGREKNTQRTPQSSRQHTLKRPHSSLSSFAVSSNKPPTLLGGLPKDTWKYQSSPVAAARGTCKLAFLAPSCNGFSSSFVSFPVKLERFRLLRLITTSIKSFLVPHVSPSRTLTLTVTRRRRV